MREYIVQGKNLTVVGATTLVAINPPTGRAIKILRAWVSQAASLSSAQCAIELGMKATAFSTLTSATPEKVNPSDPVSYITGGTAGAAGTAGINASAEGAGTHTTKYPDSFNVQVGWLWTPQLSGGEAFILSSAESLAFALKFSAAPGTLSGWNFGVVYAEIG
jgi:hypothetical protein